MAKPVLRKKRKEGVLALPDIKTYYKATVTLKRTRK